MTSAEVAVEALTSIVDSEPYKTTASWVTTRAFSLNSMLQKPTKPFELDPIVYCPYDKEH